MDQFKYSTQDQETRLSMLEAEAHDVTDNEKYDRHLSEDEIHERREQSLKVMDQMDDLAVEKKAVMDDFKAKGSLMSKKLGKLRQEAKTGITTEVGKLYAIPNYEENKMGMYNERGELVSSRRLQADERQLRMTISRAVGE